MTFDGYQPTARQQWMLRNGETPSLEGKRCMAIVGGVYTGPLYCGNKAKTFDKHNRPLCGTHEHKDYPEWIGAAPYPNGTLGRWDYNRGEKRKKR